MGGVFLKDVVWIGWHSLRAGCWGYHVLILLVAGRYWLWRGHKKVEYMQQGCQPSRILCETHAFCKQKQCSWKMKTVSWKKVSEVVLMFFLCLSIAQHDTLFWLYSLFSQRDNFFEPRVKNKTFKTRWPHKILK